jgi:hypothetical protein
MRPRHFVLSLLCALFFVFAPTHLRAQNLTTGGITGTVTDPSGAVVPNATVTVKSATKGTTQQTKTNSSGAYQFSFLDPGSYTVTVEAPGFRATTQPVNVTLGQPVTSNVKLVLAAAGATVTVTEEAPLIQTSNGNSATTFSSLQVSQIPSPGNDLTTIAQLAPGSVMNTGMGYGNFSSNGMPATSNLFTLDGMEDNDPFLNVNNSGATNLLLGQNEVQQATVVTNGYTGEYGGLAGANVNYVTKSGSNAFHGDANYFYNGRVLNANDFFNNATGTPRPFDIANQWGADIGGPIVHNKLFFYSDFEGLDVTLPTSVSVNVPTPAFESAVLAGLARNSATNNPQTLSFYNKIFSLYNSAPGSQRAQNILPPGMTASGAPTGDGCSNYGGIGTAACALQFESTASSNTHEWLWALRGDYNIGPNDRAFARFQMDRGVQATYTDSINPVFNAVSNQPEEQAQFEETHTFGGSMVNQFIASGAYYSAIFSAANLGSALSAFPTTMEFDDGSLQTLGGEDNIWPQGRNVTQMQFSDDLSKIIGNHSLKAGVLFRRNDVSDHDNGINSSGTLQMLTLNDFANGGVTGDSYSQTFASSFDLPISIYSVGAYAQDEWRMRSGFTLTAALRLEHFSNPVCQNNCFGRLDQAFDIINHDPTVPYNQAIETNQNQALYSLTPVVWEPRVGFAWQPFGTGHNTVVRGGVGMFADEFPASIADNFSGNPPLLNSFTIPNDYAVPCSSGAGCTPTNVFTDAASSNAAFLAGFHSGFNLAQIEATDPAFVPPGISGSDASSHVPTYYKWSFGLQQGIGNRTVLSATYNGNHGIYEVVPNNGVNAFCNPAGLNSPCAGGFTGLPTAAPDTRFGTVTVFTNAGVSNYNGVTVSATHRYSSGVIQGNYTWSHALDDVSNGGFLPFVLAANASLLNPENPNDIRQSYGNSDYDIRQALSINGVWTLPFGRIVTNHAARTLVDGWQISGEFFAHTGLPFTPVDLASSSALAGLTPGVSGNYGATLYANYSGTGIPSCGLAAATLNGTPCLSSTLFSPAINSAGAGGFGNVSRNDFRGPGYVDMDASLMKYTNIPGREHMRLGIGAQAFNLFNHPNFANPVADVSNTAEFGRILTAIGPPTSLLGSFLGGDASPRLLQITAKLTF